MIPLIDSLCLWQKKTQDCPDLKPHLPASPEHLGSSLRTQRTVTEHTLTIRRKVTEMQGSNNCMRNHREKPIGMFSHAYIDDVIYYLPKNVECHKHTTLEH